MKKFLAIILCLAVAFSLAACGCGNDDNVLTMATNAEFPPYEYYENNKVVGIDAEIAAAIAAKLGMELKIEDTAFDGIIGGVKGGKYDIGMAGLTVTEERQKEVLFSTPYAKGIQVVIVKEGGSIKSLDDLKDKKIGVQNATTGHIYAEGDFGKENVQAFNKGADAVEALKTDKIDCVIIDNEPAKVFVQKNEGLTILETAYAEEDYAIAVAKGNEELLEKINKALEELKADGTIDKVVSKYIPTENSEEVVEDASEVVVEDASEVVAEVATEEAIEDVSEA